MAGNNILGTRISLIISFQMFSYPFPLFVMQ